MGTPSQIQIQRSGPVRGRIRPPGSKSITNRALVCAALAKGPSILRGVLVSDDTRVMLDCWHRLGVEIKAIEIPDAYRVQGCGGRIAAGPQDLYTQNSGTTIRFLAAVVALGNGLYRLSGNARMHQRPIGDLVSALQQLQINARCEFENGFPPVQIETEGFIGGEVQIAGDISSQFLSGLLLAAPCAQQPVQIHVTTPLVSVPYVEMTRRVMATFGAPSQAYANRYAVPNLGYEGQDYTIEPDASAASYFFAAAAITGGSITLEGLSQNSLQGDVRLCEALRAMGCETRYGHYDIHMSYFGTNGSSALRGIEIDMADISDTVPTLAVVALFAEGPTTIRGVGHIRHKESDRIGDLARELRKVGAIIDEFPDGMTIRPGKLHGARLATYDDHRMAMSLALIGLRVDGIVIEEPGCTAKTYPHYFRDLQGICTPPDRPTV